jgi:membrane protease YdiL (CAAX protease family)
LVELALLGLVLLGWLVASGLAKPIADHFCAGWVSAVFPPTVLVFGQLALERPARVLARLRLVKSGRPTLVAAWTMAGLLPPAAWLWPTPAAAGALAHALPLVLLVPLAEELYFRGALLEHLHRNLGRWPAMVSSSALFGALHLPQGLLVAASMAGLAFPLAWAATRSGSVAWPIALHLLWNAHSVLRETGGGLERALLLAATLCGLAMLVALSWFAHGGSSRGRDAQAD